ncbi:HAD-IIIA family hydrolase [Egicoccus sp. AB-alg2]|uniref:HAD-IIIA family hydrolase n=1 Tax=Egicoccus sp. AB-alg2 TaxID=3242693 RepID=UPI00359EF9CF
MTAVEVRYDVVVPTIGRPSLLTVLEGLATGPGRLPDRVLVVDDRTDPTTPLLTAPPPAAFAGRLRILSGGGRGPAAARNVGWRAATAPWVAFLDDDVLPPAGWREALVQDLRGLAADVGGSQGRLHVPLPAGRRPSDWERNVAGLAAARWATADLAYRREVLAAVGGFDERFPRAYREDADLGLRVTAAGWRIVTGRRVMVHPVRPADAWVSVRLQRGNADDPFMRALHGRGWRRRAGVPAGRRPWHLATSLALAAAAVAVGARRRRAAAVAGAIWAGLTTDFAGRRIAAGPRTRREVSRMLATSVAIPVAASWHWLAGIVGLPRRLRRPGPAPSPSRTPPATAAVAERAGGRAGSRPAAVLFDRDGTLVHDVPYNGDPAMVRPVAGARQALDRLRAAGLPIAVISNQSGIGRGLLTREQVDAVNARIEQLLGPLGPWCVCPHAPDDGCPCRKPAAGLVEQAARALGVAPAACVVIGDIGADVDAAAAAGARGILVPTTVTRFDEVAAAEEVADDLDAAVDLVLGIALPTAGAGDAA